MHSLEVEHDCECPPSRGDAGDELGRGRDAIHPLLRRHVEGLVEGIGNLGYLPGVDVEGAANDAGAARELRQDAKAAEGAVVEGRLALLAEGILVGDCELERDQVEAVADWDDHGNVGRAEEGHALLQLHLALGALLELDRTGPGAVDVLHHGRHLRLGPEVVVPALEGGDSDLNENDLPHPLGAAGEEALEPKKLKGDALEALHAVDGAEDDLAAELVPDGEGPLQRRGVLKDLVQDRGLDACVDGGDGDVPAVGVDGEVVPPGVVGDHPVVEPQEAPAAGEEVAGVLEEMEPHLIGVEHAPEKVLAAPDRAEDLGGGEGRVQEEADLGHGDPPGEEAGEDEQVEAVDPD